MQFEQLPLGGLLPFLCSDELHSVLVASPQSARRASQHSNRQYLLGRHFPRVLRMKIWNCFLSGLTRGENAAPVQQPQQYRCLLRSSSNFHATITRDAWRTFQRHPIFVGKSSVGQLALTNVLHAASLRLWDVGYCQGMNFVAASLIMLVQHEEMGFEMFISLLLSHNVAEYYRPSFPRLSVAGFQMDVFVEAFLPGVHCILSKYGLTAEYYALQWFLTLYSYDLDCDVVWCVWDVFLSGGWRVMFQIGLALLEFAQPDLVALDYDDILMYLKTFVQDMVIDGQLLLEKARRFRISNRMVSAIEAAIVARQHECTSSVNASSSNHVLGHAVRLFIATDLDNGDMHWSV